MDLAAPDRNVDIVALDEALSDLEQLNPRHAEIVQLRFFAGRGNEEIAAMLGTSLRTVEGDWAKARAWLHCRMNPTEG
jgi:RNA polymerase sigma factor (sigma-70 family)